MNLERDIAVSSENRGRKKENERKAEARETKRALARQRQKGEEGAIFASRLHRGG